MRYVPPWYQLVRVQVLMFHLRVWCFILVTAIAAPAYESSPTGLWTEC